MLKPRIRYYVKNYEIIKNTNFPKNLGNSCGYVAASIILSYYQNMGKSAINKKFLNEDDSIKTEGKTIQDRLLSYIGIQKSWGFSIKWALNRYFKEYGIRARAGFGLYNFNIRNEILNSRPVILFGAFPKNPAKIISKKYPRYTLNDRFFHAIVAYGISGNYYVCHYGFKGDEEVLVDKKFIASSTHVRFY